MSVNDVLSHDDLPQLLATLTELTHPHDSLHRIELCYTTLARLTPEASPLLWAKVQWLLGDSLMKDCYGARACRVEQAIAAYEAARQIAWSMSQLLMWAEITCGLAHAYASRLFGDEVGNILEGVRLYREALKIWAYETFPEQNAETGRKLGHLLFAIGDWQGAFEAYEAALGLSYWLYFLSPKATLIDLEMIGLVALHGAFCLVQLGRGEEAVALLEESRGVVYQAWKRRRVENHEATPFCLTFAPDYSYQEVVAMAKARRKPIVYVLETTHGTVALMVEPVSLGSTLEGGMLRIMKLKTYDAFSLEDSMNVGGFCVEGDEEAPKDMPLSHLVLAAIADEIEELGYDSAVLIPANKITAVPMQVETLEHFHFSIVPCLQARNFVICL